MSINTIKYMVLAAVALVCTTSCEKDLEPYSNPDCYLNFKFISFWNNEEATTEDIDDGYVDLEAPVSYNFKFSGDATQDTVWVEAKTIGFVGTTDRAFELEQVIEEGKNNAVAGEDYIAFDNADIKKHMVVKAGEVYFKVPVVVLRTEKLKTKSMYLKIRFKANENFKNGYDKMQCRVIEFTDRLAKPSVWDEYYLDYYLGYYGEMKHQLMIEWTGKPWDDEYITKLYEEDSDYIDYLDQVFQKRLGVENAKRVAAGLDVYKEADGTEVDFAPASWW